MTFFNQSKRFILFLAFTLCYEHSIFLQARHVDAGGRIDISGLFKRKEKVISSEELCERMRTNEVLARYLRVTLDIDNRLTSKNENFYLPAHHTSNAGMQEASDQFRNLRLETSELPEWGVRERGVQEPEGWEFPYLPDESYRPGNFFNEGSTIEMWLRTNGNNPSEEQFNEIVECIYSLMGSDHFRLFSESGKEYADYLEKEILGELEPVEESKTGEIQLDSLGNVVKQGKKNTNEIKSDISNRLLTSFSFSSIYDTDTSGHNNGLLFLLMLTPEGENTINNIGPPILDLWERMLEVIVTEQKNQLMWAQEEENEHKKIEIATKRAEEDAAKNADPLEEEYNTLYFAYLSVKMCYESRRGYAAIYLSREQYDDVRESYLKHRKLSLYPEAKKKKVEQLLDEGLSFRKALLSNFTRENAQQCEDAVLTFSWVYP